MAGSAMAVNQTLYPKDRLGYDLQKDLVPITGIYSVPLMFVASKQSGIQSLAQYIDEAKKEGGKLTFASAGIGGTQHLAAEMLNHLAKIQATHIPYKGSSAAQVDLMGNQVPMLADAVPAILPLVQAGKVIPLAVTTQHRLAQLPGVPTASETPGLGGFDAVGWGMLLVPSGTPASVQERLSKESQVVLNSAEMRKFFNERASQPLAQTMPQALSFLQAEIKKWGAMVSLSGAQPE